MHLPFPNTDSRQQDAFKPTLLRAEQCQLSQTPCVGHVLQSFNYISGPFLDLSLQYVHVFSSGQSTPHTSQQCWGKGKDLLSGPAGNTPPNTVQDTFFAKITHCWLTFIVGSYIVGSFGIHQDFVLFNAASDTGSINVSLWDQWYLSVKYWVFNSLGIRCLKLLKLSKVDFSQCRANIIKWHQSNLLTLQVSYRNLKQLTHCKAAWRDLLETHSEVHITKKCSNVLFTKRLLSLYIFYTRYAQI